MICISCKESPVPEEYKSYDWLDENSVICKWCEESILKKYVLHTAEGAVLHLIKLNQKLNYVIESLNASIKNHLDTVKEVTGEVEEAIDIVEAENQQLYQNAEISMQCLLDEIKGKQ